ncbi:APC family permease [Dactylosporangium sp. NPDC005572]|uniref:APC family permease n=1 Tax=Dactylosporangium sp. NPDC005572 TaxID=3156889 RepID=UPI0033ABC89C
MPRVGLIRRHINGFTSWQFQVGASSPMAVLAGGVVSTYATIGVLGVPLSFPIIGLALALLSVGYLAMTYRAGNAAPAYAFMALGLGPAWGIAFGVLAIVAYNSIQISLYGLFGATMAGVTGVGGWQVWAWIGWLVVAVFGVANFSLGKVVIAVVGMAEIGVIALLVLAAFTHPHGGHISVAPLTVGALWDERGQVGGVFALSVAAFVGFDTGAAYAEEGKTDKTVIKATVATLVFLPVFYALVAWALPVWTGPDEIVAAARNTATNGLPFGILERHYGSGVSVLAEMLLVSSVLIAALSFHNTIGRYVHSVAREGVIPSVLGTVGLRSGRFAGATAPASLLQTAVAGVVITIFMVAGADPIQGMFIWLSSGAAVAILVMLVGVSISAVLYFRKGGGTTENVLVRTALPIAGAAAGGALIWTIVANQSALLGVPADSWQQGVIVGAVALTLAAGFLHAWLIKTRFADRYANVGRGRPDEVTVPDYQLGDIRV